MLKADPGSIIFTHVNYYNIYCSYHPPLTDPTHTFFHTPKLPHYTPSLQHTETLKNKDKAIEDICGNPRDAAVFIG